MTNSVGHVQVGRLEGQTFTPIGLGVLIDERFVLVPLALSGPLRPRIGVHVLLAEAAPIAVVRIHRSEPSFGDALLLELAEPCGLTTAGPAPDGTPLQDWLTSELGAAHQTSGEIREVGKVRGPLAADAEAMAPRARRRGWICTICPPACR